MVEGVQSRFRQHGVDCVEELLAIAIEQGGMGGVEEKAFLLCRGAPGIPGNGSLSVPMTTAQGTKVSDTPFRTILQQSET